MLLKARKKTTYQKREQKKNYELNIYNDIVVKSIWLCVLFL